MRSISFSSEVAFSTEDHFREKFEMFSIYEDEFGLREVSYMRDVTFKVTLEETSIATRS